MLQRNQSLALYMEASLGEIQGKMGNGVLRYSPNPIACIIDSTKVGQDHRITTGIDRPCPIVSSVSEAAALGSEVLVLGIAPPGGLIPKSWWEPIDEAIAKGLSVVNGLHDLVAPRYPHLKSGQWVWDVRIEPPGLQVASGLAAKLENKRVLMIGTDMGIGKMTAGLEVYREAITRGINAEFVATGQIGITVTGRGVPLDAVRLDYAAGSIEREVMAAKDADIVIVEGQGALIHPGSSANLPLLRGSMPSHLILCHKAGMKGLQRLPHILVPPLREYVKLYEDLSEAAGAFPRAKLVAGALNTFGLEHDAALQAVAQYEQELGVPADDPVRFGAHKLLDALLAG